MQENKNSESKAKKQNSKDTKWDNCDFAEKFHFFYVSQT